LEASLGYTARPCKKYKQTKNPKENAKAGFMATHSPDEPEQ
jgi:hypothetical protein